MRRLKCFALASLTLLFAAPATAAPTTPLRHMSFSFTMTNTSTTERQGSGLTDSGGVSNGAAIQRSSARRDDKGDINADILAATSDGGLVVRTSENGNEIRSPAEIAIKGDGTILTTAQTVLTEEQKYILAFLGRNLMPFTEASVGKTWTISYETAKGGTDLTTLRITAIEDPVVHLAVRREIKNRAGAYDMTLTGNIDYDYKRVVPTGGSLQTFTHQQGADGLQTGQGLLTFSLKEDSFTKRS